MIRLLHAGCCWVGIVLPALTAMAQDRAPSEQFIRQQREIDRALAQQRFEAAPIDQLLDFQYGGSIDYYIFHFDDGVQSSRLFQRPGMSAWMRATVDDGAHEFFARIRLNYNYFRDGDEFDRQQDWAGPNFDRAWYRVDLGKAFHLPNPADLPVSLTVGRQAVVFGTGYVLDMPLDAVLIDARLGDFRVQGLIGKTIGSYPNIDRSGPVDSHSNRNFFGAQVIYEGLKRHRPFAYAIWQQDHTDERPQDLFQEYDYDTQYWGFGSRGELLPDLNYWAEAAFETGRSYGDGDYFLQRDTVHAYGWNVGIEYLFRGPMRPRVAAEYMFASGDSGRLFSPTNAAGGNRGDNRDTSFVAFGYRDTGIAAAPALSNMHIWRAGGSITPFDSVELLREIEVGTDWFLYAKHHSRGAISDETSDRFEGYVGWEMDYFVNWRITSDLSWTVRWGAFFPGLAYSDRGTRHFVFSGLTWSF